jgi:uncharacterized membrane protein
MRLILCSLAVLALAACSPETDTPDPTEPPPAPVELGGVDLTQPLRALGTEPFWGVDITAETLVYSGVDRPEQTARHDGPEVQGTVATWSGILADGGRLDLTLMATECSDGMSDRTYPLTARLVVGDETLNGCAATVSAIMNSGESGLVVDQPADPAS